MPFINIHLCWYEQAISSSIFILQLPNILFMFLSSYLRWNWIVTNGGKQGSLLKSEPMVWSTVTLSQPFCVLKLRVQLVIVSSWPTNAVCSRQCWSICFFLILTQGYVFIDLFREREKEKHRCERETSISCQSFSASTRGQTCKLSLPRAALQPTEPPSQGSPYTVLKINFNWNIEILEIFLWKEYRFLAPVNSEVSVTVNP